MAGWLACLVEVEIMVLSMSSINPSKAERRLNLFYLANDVLQNSRKKGKEFSNAFTKILRDAMQFLSEKTIKGNVERVIKIWEERKLFEKDYLEALRNKLASGDVPVISKKPKEKAIVKEKEKAIVKEKEKEVKPAKQKRLPPADFKPSKLIDALKALRDFEGELTLKESQLNSLRIDASDLESVRQLKDRTGGGKFCEEYELATSKLEEFSETLRREQEERKNIVKALEDGEAFYDVSYGEVKVIVHAYKTFGNRLTSLKKKVDSKVNRLAQKEAEKAKTGPVSAPQASFLTSGLPDVAEGSAPSTPTQGQQGSNKSSEDDKATDPTVDNIEVADMDIEDDSDSEKSETSEEASAEDPKSSNDQTPNSTGSSDSMPTQSTTQELEITPVISPVPSIAPARPLTTNLGSMMPLQGTMMPNQPQIVPPRPPVGMVTHPFMGVQGVRFPAQAPQFRPGVPPIQPLPGMVQNQLLQPSGTLPGPGQITSQGQPFSQMPRPAGLLPNANTPLAGGMGTLQPFPLGSGFVRGQAPLPVVAVPAPVQVITNSMPKSEITKDNASHPQRVLEVGSPDSEESAPSPVGSPELHLAEGDETPETTPAPLGDVDVNDNTGFQTNKSFFENPVGKQSVVKPFVPTPVSESSSSSSSTPSTSDQLGGQDAALAKKDNGQKVSAVDILAQLLSRGRKLQQPNDSDANSASAPITPPVAAPVAAPVTPQQNSDKPQKPLLSLIDSLFPKLSDSIKTLKEKEKAVNSPNPQFNPPVVNVPTSLPARPLPSESQFQHPSNVGREQPVFQQSGLKSILKKGPKADEEFLTTGQTAQEFGPNDGAFERNSMNHADHADVQHQGPVGGDPSSNFPGDNSMGRLVEMQEEPTQNHDVSRLEQQGSRMNVSDGAPTATPTSHLPPPGTHFQGPPIMGGPPRFPQERPFDRPLDMSPRGLPPFGPRPPFQEAHGPQFQQSSTGPPVDRHEGPPDMPGRVPPEQPPHGHSSRGSFRDGPPRRPSDTVHQEHHYMEEALHGNPPVVALDDKHAPMPRNNEDGFVNGPPGVKRLPHEGPPIHRPDPRQSPHEQVPRDDRPPPHRASSYPGMMDDLHRRREFEHWEEHHREPYTDHRRGPWDFPHDRPGPPPPDWRGPPVSPLGDPKRADFREDDPSMWTSFESPGRPPRTFDGYREGPPEFDRFHGYGPPGGRRHSVGDFENERMRFPLKRPGPPPARLEGNWPLAALREIDKKEKWNPLAGLRKVTVLTVVVDLKVVVHSCPCYVNARPCGIL
ncbi:hypothetical protein ACROYT_G001539 [Oculina patagonica]